MSITYDELLDVKGAKCPMPIVKSRQAIKKIAVGSVLKVVATDRGSMPDFQGWADMAKDIELVDQETVQENGQDLYVHYVRRLK